MRKIPTCVALALSAVLADIACAFAAAADPYIAPLTPRECFLASAVGAIIACALTSFFLAGRVSERTHVALALFIVLIGAFCLLSLFGLSGRVEPGIGAVVVLGLIGLFKLMNQFEIRRNRERSSR